MFAYTRMHALATALTLVTFAALAGAAHLMGWTLDSTVHRGMHYIGYVHFAVGYVFFFSAPAIQAQMSGSPAGFWSKAGLCLAAGLVLLQQPTPVAYPLVQTLFYLHAAENSAYKIVRLSPDGAEPALKLEALFPLALVLLGLRVLPGFALHTAVGVVQLGLVIACVALVRALLPVRTDWRAGARVIGQSAAVVGSFAVVALLFRETGIAFDLFIIWHCIIWFLFTWATRPSARTQLVRAHMWLGAAYAVLFACYTLRLPWARAALPLVVGSDGFLWQSALHILLSFAFRRFGAAPAPRAQAAPAVA